MYITQIVIDCMDRHAMRTLSDIYRLHQLVMTGFMQYDEPSRVLFRVEPEVRETFVRLLIQSHLKPSWEQTDQWQRSIIAVQIKEFSPQFRKGTQFRFRLRANPVVKKNGKRQGLIRDEVIVEWLKSKEERIGATFPSVLSIDEGYVTGNKKVGEKIDRVNIKTVRYEGSLKVTDANKFHEAFTKCIGPAKAFGCGLISLARM